MRTVGRPGLNLIAAARVFQTVTVTVGGLYLATHSVTVTMIGTCAATAITALSSLPENVGRLRLRPGLPPGRHRRADPAKRQEIATGHAQTPWDGRVAPPSGIASVGSLV
jgi:hypothetical protein